MQIRICLFPWILIWCFHLAVYQGKKCYGEGHFKKKFFVGERNLSFRIEVSRRNSHQLVSHIAKILLEEVIGYENAELCTQPTENTTITLQKISNCDIPEANKSCQEIGEKGPDLMINLELWMPPGFNLEKWLATQKVEDCGPLGPVGRSGFFIEDSTVSFFWNENRTIIDHYRAFLNPEITRYFDLSSDESVISKINLSCSTLSKPKDLDCGEDGLYRPPQCKNALIKCATILSDYPDSTFYILKEVINRYELLVNIGWLGDDFETKLSKMITEKHVLFYHRKPMMLSGIKNITHVSFTGCETAIESGNSESTLCGFELNQIQKVIWSEIKASASHAYQLIRAINFSQEQYDDILLSYYKGISRGSNYYNIACAWLRENSMVWKEWVDEEAKEKTTLYVGGIFPINGVYWSQNSVVEAAYMAARAINEDNTILSNYNMKILVSDGECATDKVMTSFIDYVKNDTFKNMVGILGPACSDTVEPIAGVAKYFNTIIISYSAEGNIINSEEKYPFFFRTIPENKVFRDVYLKLFKKLGYIRISTLSEGQKYPEYISYLQDSMEANNMAFVVNRKFRQGRTYLDMLNYLKDLKNKGAKIIIGDFYDYAARYIMCAAYLEGMTARNGYIWFLPSWYEDNWYDTDKLNDTEVRCSTKDMIEAINGHMTLAYQFYGDPNNIMQENISIKDWRKHYSQVVKKMGKAPSNFAGYTYDAVWVYAYALDRLFSKTESHVANLHTKRTSENLIDLLRETSFNGVSGYLSFENSSRTSDIVIYQWLDCKMYKIGIYNASSKDKTLELYERKIKWLTPNGLKPEDGSKVFADCEVEALRAFFGIRCDVAKTVANVLGIAAFVIVVIILIAIFKQRYEKRMALTEKRMKELGLLSNGVPFALDEWELPRDHIVINRKLGEGAFGTVYGGEALVGNKGWIAVAVKTLKRGSKTEEKLDFLSEAEVMKQFDHVNIVKLVGVCTTGEPVYTVMEFMLYGDLKTYLLSRRNMASEKDRSKSDEVSDKRLTNMALDIARGLSYLADQNFVHRDLACRNCLVNTSRSAKIADFGMCRAMYDHDYYKHNKKGMLPIRWMAPESLIDGLFTPMSDVWSYGVVLYEIITFASFPYQGFSHEQVLMHVKNYKTLPVPKACKSELERLLLKCWSSDPQSRPKATEIVEILAHNPELITPCLDVPAASVALEDSSTIEVKSCDRSRGHSFSSVWQGRKSVTTVPHGQLSVLDASQLFHVVHDASCATKYIGFKDSRKGSSYESFKRAKRDLPKDKTVNYLSDSTHL